MTTRADVADKAFSFNGLYDGHGYDCSNRFSIDEGRTKEAWCVDFVDDVCRLVGHSLPPYTASVPVLWLYAVSQHATRHSWEAEPGDPIVYCWDGGNPDGDHVEMTKWWHNNVLRTIGGNSSPSNVDHFRGVGGVHQHDWDVKLDKGLSVIKGAINLAKIVDLTKPVAQPPHPPVEGPRQLELKSPYLRGADVKKVQEELNDRMGHTIDWRVLVVDGVFGPSTARAVTKFQHRNSDPFGVVGPHTRQLLGIRP